LFRALQREGKLATKVWQTIYCALRRLARLVSLSRFDVVVIHREAFPFFTPFVERWVLRSHSTVVYSFDDAVYRGHGDVSRLNHPWLYRLKYGRGYDEVIGRSAHVIAGSRILAEHASKHNDCVSVIPTVVDCDEVSYKPPRQYDSAPVTIGWMGSRSTARYLSLIEPVLMEIARVHRDRVRIGLGANAPSKPSNTWPRESPP
jgi:hypothetical protein